MSDPTEEARRVAEGLNLDQRWLLGQLDLAWRTWRDGLPLARLKGLRGFGQSNLVASKYDHSGAHLRLTEEGLAVKAILETNHD